jgi:TOMM system kinase/cyclase fusion protein
MSPPWLFHHLTDTTLIGAKRLATDEDGRFLVWTGSAIVPSDLPAVTSLSPSIPGERRQLTVQFVDLVGSTSLSQQLDPEELRRVIQAYRDTCATVIRRFDGYLAKYIGDGLLVYFGYPKAHEDDAPRAVRVALGILAALPELNASLQSTLQAHGSAPLQVRIGIHTGLVVAGEMGVGDQPEPLGIVGETPNIAARVQERADPNSVVLSPTTARLVTGLFDYEEREPQQLKGVSAPLAVYRVLQESAAQNRFDVAVQKGLTPLVGRAAELGLLQQRWEQANAGAGQVVLLSGEPGIGKSRLVQELREQLTHGGITRIEFRCSPYHQNSALYPIIEHLQRLLQFAREDSPIVKLEKLQRTLSHYHFPQADTVPLLAALLSLPHPVDYPPLTGSPQKQREKTQAALMSWLVDEAERQPVYTIWEDVHWADPSTLELLNLVVDQVPTTRFYVLLTFRPEFTQPWGNRSHVTQLTISRLARAEVETMVKEVAGGKTLPPEVIRQIVARTDGVPLFIEELTKTVVESGLLTAVNGHYELTGPLPPLAIPSTLQDSLMARLDRLATVREIAQLGATIGRQFSYGLIHAVSHLDEAKLQQGLQQLVESELVYQRGLLPEVNYFFKHALIQDVAYQSLLKSARQQYHHDIAQVLADHFPDTVATQPELLAHHFTEAGLIRQALPYWQQAGERAVQHSAHTEAIRHLTKALELLGTLSETPERLRQELALQMALGAPLLATRGYAAREVGRTYARARELCGQMGDTSQLFPVLFGLWVFYYVQGSLQRARELVEECFSLARSSQDSGLLVESHIALAATLFHQGEFQLALDHVEQCLALYDPEQHGSHIYQFGQDPAVASEVYAALTLWQLGYPDQADKRMHKALSLAQKLAHPFSLAFALLFSTWFHQYRREPKLTHAQAEATITCCTEQGFSYWLVFASVIDGWAVAEEGQGEAGIAQMRESLTSYQATGAELNRQYFLAMLADACVRTGHRVEEGLAALAEAQNLVQTNGERNYEGELHRLKGELLLQSSILNREPEQLKEAETCLLEALAITRRSGAKSLELRASMSLSQFLLWKGKNDEARRVLAETYGWFTEGFATPDLKDAKMLLKKLDGTP